jgi:hypothetical protein
MISAFLRKRFVSKHGQGDTHQYDLYRCESCGGIVTWKMIRQEADHACGTISRIRPTNPTTLESIRLLLW